MKTVSKEYIEFELYGREFRGTVYERSFTGKSEVTVNLVCENDKPAEQKHYFRVTDSDENAVRWRKARPSDEFPQPSEAALMALTLTDYYCENFTMERVATDSDEAAFNTVRYIDDAIGTMLKTEHHKIHYHPFFADMMEVANSAVGLVNGILEPVHQEAQRGGMQEDEVLNILFDPEDREPLRAYLISTIKADPYVGIAASVVAEHHFGFSLDNETVKTTTRDDFTGDAKEMWAMPEQLFRPDSLADSYGYPTSEEYWQDFSHLTPSQRELDSKEFWTEPRD